MSQGRIFVAGQITDESHRIFNSYDIMYSNKNKNPDAREFSAKKYVIRPSVEYLRASYKDLSNYG